ncbi:hypothetical protein [Sphingomonas aliaeris]|uniref:hypothetical protein n=1 Tax=Sphingomonas aliaeris TaxID=2759526 RepID=UPI001CED3FC7|nr:hypothetical protein [Sphingomonas aliaeris]
MRVGFSAASATGVEALMREVRGLLRSLASDQLGLAGRAAQSTLQSASRGADVDDVAIVIDAPDKIDAETSKGGVIDETKGIRT